RWLHYRCLGIPKGTLEQLGITWKCCSPQMSQSIIRLPVGFALTTDEIAQFQPGGCCTMDGINFFIFTQCRFNSTLVLNATTSQLFLNDISYAGHEEVHRRWNPFLGSTVEHVVVPVLHSEHWILLHYAVGERMVKCYDSLNTGKAVKTSYQQYICRFVKYFNGISRTFGFEPLNEVGIR
ncbi:unnamed protein product, partial [Owenia fusiformis]